MEETTIPEKINLLEQVFTKIQQEKMHDMPILNPALHVKAIGFRAWLEGQLGVLITPWFMNMLFLPENAHNLPLPYSDAKQIYTFPSGQYAFLAQHDEKLGVYYSCSLFSPMFEFSDQETAEATAETILTLLFAESESNKPVSPSEQTEKTLSRREWLRGQG